MSGSFAAGLRLNVDPTGAEEGGRRTEAALGGVKREARETEQQMGRMGDRSDRELTRTQRAASGAAARMNVLAAAATAAALAFASRSAGAYNQYSRSLAEVSTLIEGTEEEMAYLDRQARELAGTFGGTATQQAQAFYQAISAGAGSVQEANELLAVANRLAVGGVTDVTTAVDGLTTVMNAYRSSGLGASEASDILFTGVRAGKTTIAELSAALGQVVPTSASVGIGLDEIVSATAALTASGQSTSQAITGIRQAMVSVISPTSEAQKLAERIGLDFSVTALRAKGLAGFLDEVRTRTGGSQEAMAQLFGSVEALNAVLALTGDAGVTFNQTLQDMASASGATQTAFDQVSESLSQRLSVQMGILNGYALQLGQVVLSAVVPALETATAAMGFLADNSHEVQGIILATATAAGVYFAPAIYAAVTATGAWIAALITLRGVLIATGIGAIVIGAGLLIGKFIELVEKTGGVGEAFRLLKNVGEEALERIGFATGSLTAKFLSGWNDIKSSAYNMFQGMVDRGYSFANTMVGIAVGSKDAFVAAFQALPDALGNLMYATANTVVAGVEALINAVIGSINNFTSSVRDMLNGLPDWAKPEGGFTFGGGINEVSLGGVENPYAGSEGVAQSAGDAFTSALGQNYVGRAPQGAGELAEIFERTARSYEDLSETLGRRATQPLRSIEELRAAIAGVNEEVESGAGQNPETPLIPDPAALPGDVDIPDFSGGSSGGGASTAVDEVDELSDAYENLRSSIDPAYARSREFAEAQEVVKAALDAGVISQQEYIETMRLLNEEYSDLNETQVEGAEKAAKFFTSIVTGAKSASEAVSDLASRLADKLLNQGFEMLIGGLFGGGGPLSGGAGILDFIFNANGNSFDAGSITAFANGGVVSRATPFGMSNGKMGVMGEAGPEAILPLSRGSDGKLGVKSEVQNSQSETNVNVSIPVNVENYSNSEVEVNQSDERIDIIIKKEVNNVLASGGADRSMNSRYGLRPRSPGV